MINQQIMVYSVPRTGSTLIWQCLAKIFTKVLKSHRNRVWDYSIHNQKEIRISTRKRGAVLDYSCPCVITERDSMDCFLSQWRNDNWQTQVHFHEWLCLAHGDEPSFDIRPAHLQWREKEFTGWTRKNDESQVFDIEKFKEVCDARTEACFVRSQFKPVLGTIRSIREMMIIFRQHLEDLEKVKREYSGPVLVLRYEQFWDDYDYIFSNFEEFFDITLSEETKTEIKNTSSRSANRIIQEKLNGGFQAHDMKTHIHGGHIFTGEVGWSKKVLGEKNIRRIQTLLTCDLDDILEIELEA